MKICCIKTDALPEKYVKETIVSKENIYDIAQGTEIEWIERKDAEKDVRYKQIIPYAIVENSEGKVACYPRHGTETRLHNLYSCGVGGHVDECDKSESLKLTVEKGLRRELGEEFADFDAEKISLEYKGIINEVETETGLVHLGAVYLAKCSEDYEPTPAEELDGMEWFSLETLRELKTELWSQMALNLIYGEE